MMQLNGDDRTGEDEGSPEETPTPAWVQWGEIASNGIQVESWRLERGNQGNQAENGCMCVWMGGGMGEVEDIVGKKWNK